MLLDDTVSCVLLSWWKSQFWKYIYMSSNIKQFGSLSNWQNIVSNYKCSIMSMARIACRARRVAFPQLWNQTETVNSRFLKPDLCHSFRLQAA
jgi:hypothetical protein